MKGTRVNALLVRLSSLGNPSTRQGPVHRLLPPQSGDQAADSPLLLELRAERCRGAPRPGGETLDFLVDLLFCHDEALAPRDGVEDQRARHRGARRLSLRLTELPPVDAGLSRVDVLLHELSG